MLDAFKIPISSAVLLFPFIAIGIFIPICIVHYRRLGYVHGNRILVFYSFLFFLLTALFLVILPLPLIDEGFCELYRDTKIPQLSPFKFIQDIIQASGLSTTNFDLRLLIDTPEFFQAFFNFLLLLPLGVYLRYYFHFGIIKTIGIAFILTLFFEVTQLTGIYGIYACPYRLFDVDDLILNTVGTVVGFAITPLLVFLPDIQAKPRSILHVTILRRFVALVIDLVMLNIFIELVLASSNLILSFTGYLHHSTVLFWAEIVTTILYFVAFPFLTKGYTIGKWLVRIRITNMTRKPPTIIQIFGRYMILLYLPPMLEFFTLVTMDESSQPTVSLFTLGLIAVSLLHPLVVYGIAILRNDNRGLHDLITKTTHQVDERDIPNLMTTITD